MYVYECRFAAYVLGSGQSDEGVPHRTSLKEFRYQTLFIFSVNVTFLCIYSVNVTFLCMYVRDWRKHRAADCLLCVCMYLGVDF